MEGSKVMVGVRLWRRTEGERTVRISLGMERRSCVGCEGSDSEKGFLEKQPLSRHLEVKDLLGWFFHLKAAKCKQ